MENKRLISALTSAVLLPAWALFGAGLVKGAYGQIAEPSTPPPGDPEVFGLFLRYQDSVSQDVETLRKKDPKAAQSHQQRIAASIGVTTSDLVTINTVYRTMKSQFDALDAEAAVYTNNGKRRDPDLRVLQTFEIRRQQILADGLKKLQSSLAPAAWKTFYAHVDGEYRKGVWRTTFGGPTPGARQ